MNKYKGKSAEERAIETFELGRQDNIDRDDSDEGLFLNIEIDRNTLIIINDLLNTQNRQSYIKRVIKKEATLGDFIHEAINREIERVRIYNLLYSGSKYIRLRKPRSGIKNRFKIMIDKLQIKPTELSELTGISYSELKIILNNEGPILMEHFLLIWDTLGHPPIEECLD